MAAKVPRLSTVPPTVPPADDLSSSSVPMLEKSEKELKKMKVTELVSMLTEIDNRVQLPKKPRKQDVLEKLFSISMPRPE